ncbi:MAG: hypothetical protein ACOYW4_09435 [Bacillota bacterium]
MWRFEIVGILALPQQMLIAAALGVVGSMVIAFSLGMLVGHRQAAGIGGNAADGGSSEDRMRGRGGGRRGVRQGKAALSVGEAVKDAAVEAEAAAQRGIRDLERRSAVAAQLLDEVEAKIVRLKEILAACEGGQSALNPAAQPATEVELLRLPEKHSLVFNLAGQGLSVPEIARRVGIGRGEAQLILDLRAKNEAHGSGTPT